MCLSPSSRALIAGILWVFIASLLTAALEKSDINQTGAAHVYVKASRECCCHEGVYVGRDCVQVCDWCQVASKGNARNRGFPAEHCNAIRRSILFTPPADVKWKTLMVRLSKALCSSPLLHSHTSNSNINGSELPCKPLRAVWSRSNSSPCDQWTTGDHSCPAGAILCIFKALLRGYGFKTS